MNYASFLGAALSTFSYGEISGWRQAMAQLRPRPHASSTSWQTFFCEKNERWNGVVTYVCQSKGRNIVKRKIKQVLNLRQLMRRRFNISSVHSFICEISRWLTRNKLKYVGIDNAVVWLRNIWYIYSGVCVLGFSFPPVERTSGMEIE